MELDEQDRAKRRARLRTKGIIVAISSAIYYALLWRSGVLRGPNETVAFDLALPLFFGFLAIFLKPGKLAAACGVMLGIIALIAGPAHENVILHQGQIEMRNAHSIGQELLKYATAHDGNFPKTLAEVNLDGIPAEARHFHDPRTKAESNWLYFGGDNYQQHSPHHTVILASPPISPPMTGPHHQQDRIVALSDGSAMITEEEYFQALLPEPRNRQ